MPEQKGAGGIRIPLQVGSELRIGNNGEITIDNPEIELAGELTAADAVLEYRFDRAADTHILRLLNPVSEVRRDPGRLHRNREISS
ncbi:MAG: hypothetical protein ABUS49_08360 [Acidobacteriota bacterium]